MRFARGCVGGDALDLIQFALVGESKSVRPERKELQGRKEGRGGVR